MSREVLKKNKKKKISRRPQALALQIYDLQVLLRL